MDTHTHTYIYIFSKSTSQDMQESIKQALGVRWSNNMRRTWGCHLLLGGRKKRASTT